MGAKRIPFWLGQHKNSTEEIGKVVETKKKWEDMTKSCRICGKLALYRVMYNGYCKEHYKDAEAQARKMKGLK